MDRELVIEEGILLEPDQDPPFPKGRMLRKIASRLEPFQYTVWNEFSPLAVKHKAINLGQGFPSFEPPEFVKSALRHTVTLPLNQYSRSQGHLPLVEEIAQVYSRKHHRPINPATEVLVGMGASELLLSAFLGLVDPGDQVVVFDPYFDIYIPQIRMAGGIPVAVPLVPPSAEESKWNIDFTRLEQAFNEKTRVFVLNTPLNPIGKVYTDEEMTKIAAILAKWPQVSIISDEVYEHIVFSGSLNSISNYGDLWNRTATLSSAGKIFSVTGWKTGWAVGGAEVIRKMAVAHQWTVFCSNTPCQAAVAMALKQAEEPYNGHLTYYKWLLSEYRRKLARLTTVLTTSKRVKLRTMQPEGGFFLLAEIVGEVPQQYRAKATLDFAFCRWVTEQYGVTAIPASAFFTKENEHLGKRFARFALCKRDEEYEEVAARLESQ